jgi:RimJ/RimL family protein N-acetyltransferase
MFLKSERLGFRRVVQGDEVLLHELDSEPEVLRFIPRKPATLDHLKQKTLPAVLRLYDETPGMGFWVAEELASGRFVGWFHLKAVKEDPEAGEIGYRLKREFWGAGLATEGSLALIDYGRKTLKLKRITGVAMTENKASIRVLEKCGLRFEKSYPHCDETMKSQGFETVELSLFIRTLSEP